MSKRIKKVIAISILVIIIIIAIIATYFVARNNKEKAKIDEVLETYSDHSVQERLEKEDISTTDDMLLKIDGETVLGVIKIDKINFEGLIYEGTMLDTLDKGVGHFEHSPFLKGNVCLAAHNYKKYWAKLYTLKDGDLITYTSFLGTKQYKVNNVKQISETDWSLLQNTDKNILTLITCVKGKPTLRLCVQAVEII